MRTSTVVRPPDTPPWYTRLKWWAEDNMLAVLALSGLLLVAGLLAVIGPRLGGEPAVNVSIGVDDVDVNNADADDAVVDNADLSNADTTTADTDPAGGERTATGASSTEIDPDSTPSPQRSLPDSNFTPARAEPAIPAILRAGGSPETETVAAPTATPTGRRSEVGPNPTSTAAPAATPTASATREPQRSVVAVDKPTPTPSPTPAPPATATPTALPAPTAPAAPAVPATPTALPGPTCPAASTLTADGWCELTIAATVTDSVPQPTCPRGDLVDEASTPRCEIQTTTEVPGNYLAIEPDPGAIADWMCLDAGSLVINPGGPPSCMSTLIPGENPSPADLPWECAESPTADRTFCSLPAAPSVRATCDGTPTTESADDCLVLETTTEFIEPILESGEPTATCDEGTTPVDGDPTRCLQRVRPS